MQQDISYQQKFSQLRPWLDSLFEAVKKELRNDHLKADIRFYKKHFASKTPAKLTLPEISEAYAKEIIEEGNEQLGEFISNRWLLKHGDIYNYFAEQLTTINPNFDQITEIDPTRSREIAHKGVEQFGALNIYIFSVLNSVSFPQRIFEELADLARQTQSQAADQVQEAEQQRSLDNILKIHALEMSRMIDKYEKKLAGLQKKYVDDTTALKKQMAALQRKLSEK